MNTKTPSLPGKLRTAEAVKASFLGGGDFFSDVRAAVNDYLASGDHRERALHRLWIKTGIGFGALLSSWAWLTFNASTLWSAVPAFGVLLFGGIVVSVCVLHDANHGAYFESRRANFLLGWMVDVFLGFGSYAWRIKHNIHHAYPNVDGYDDDINHSPLLRIAPSQESKPWYRWQHIYVWLLYALALLRWHITDLLNLRRRRLSASSIAPPRGWNLVGVLLGKALFASLVFVIPWLLGHHRWWVVLSFYLAFTLTSSLFMAIVFQLAHCVEEADFVSANELITSPREWAVHEVRSTADFCVDNRALTWFIGSLNLQIEHHLFPRLPHTLYPEIAPIVRGIARKHGIPVTSHVSLASGLASHLRHLREMGRLGLPVELEMG